MCAILDPIGQRFRRPSTRYLFLLIGLLFAIAILVASFTILAYLDAQAMVDTSIRTYVEWGGILLALLKLLHTFSLWRFMRHQEKFEQELQLARIRADHASSARGEFLSTMSHEIRTPMNAIIGMAALIRTTPLDAEQDGFARAIEDSAEALMAIINDILDFSRIDAGKLAIEALDFDPLVLVEASIDVLAVKAREKGLRLVSHIDPNLPSALAGDPGRLRQVLLNLIGNAIKFTARGDVTVRVRCLEQTHAICQVRFEVIDTGIGVDAAIQDKLFSPFMQGDSSVTRTYGGTGLGLSICKRLIDLMGGRIGVRSQAGAGSTFWFELSMPILSAPLDHQQLNTSLLLVMPSGNVSQVIKDYATAFGVRVQQAENAMQASAISMQGDGEHIALVDASLVDNVAELMTSMRAIDGRLRFMLLVASECDKDMLNLPDSVSVLTLPLHRAALYKALSGNFADNPNQCTEQSSEHLRCEDDVAVPASMVSEQVRDACVILLAEDNLINQRLVMHQLNQLGYNVDIVANGQEALDALDRYPYALVLMDCQMPVLDGLTATRLIRNREHTSGHHVPIIAMTANAMTGDRERCLEAGMDDYLSKPIWREQLEHMMARHITLPASLQEPAVIDGVRLRELFDGDELTMQRMLALSIVSIKPVLEAWHQAVAAQNFSEALALQHRLAGSSSNLGLDRLHALVMRADVAARAADIQALQKLQTPISEAFQHLLLATNEIKVLT